MNEFLMICERIVPEIVSVLKERYKILNHLVYEEPIGRRTLATATDLPERTVRSHIELMRANGLVDIYKPGIFLTDEGLSLIHIYRSERIRTYNYPQGRVTDHRINLTLYKLDAILNGDLDEIIQALNAADQAAKMQEANTNA